VNHQNTGTPLARQAEDQPPRLDGSIHVADPEPKPVPAAFLALPSPDLGTGPHRVRMTAEGAACVGLDEVGLMRVYLYSGDQARALIVAFGRAAELLDEAAAKEPVTLLSGELAAGPDPVILLSGEADPAEAREGCA
jgi:hypothetical protein